MLFAAIAYLTAESQYRVLGFTDLFLIIGTELIDTEPGRRSVEPSAEWSTIDAAVRLAQFLCNHAPDAISWIGPDARFVYVNETFCCALQDHLNILTRSSQDQRAPSLPNRTEPGD